MAGGEGLDFSHPTSANLAGYGGLKIRQTKTRHFPKSERNSPGGAERTSTDMLAKTIEIYGLYCEANVESQHFFNNNNHKSIIEFRGEKRSVWRLYFVNVIMRICCCFF